MKNCKENIILKHNFEGINDFIEGSIELEKDFQDILGLALKCVKIKDLDDKTSSGYENQNQHNYTCKSEEEIDKIKLLDFGVEYYFSQTNLCPVYKEVEGTFKKVAVDKDRKIECYKLIKDRHEFLLFLEKMKKSVCLKDIVNAEICEEIQHTGIISAMVIEFSENENASSSSKMIVKYVSCYDKFEDVILSKMETMKIIANSQYKLYNISRYAIFVK